METYVADDVSNTPQSDLSARKHENEVDKN